MYQGEGHCVLSQAFGVEDAMEAVDAWAVSNTAATVDDDRDECHYDESRHDANRFEGATDADHRAEDVVCLSNYAPAHRDASRHHLHHPGSTAQDVAVRTSIRAESTADPRRSSNYVFRDHREIYPPSPLDLSLIHI